MYFQQTIHDVASCTDVGLHTGKRVRMTVRPAPPDHGIVFVRVDLPGHPRVKACPETVVASKYATTLGQDGAMVGTVEHLLSAFGGLGIDNALVEVDGTEVPIMDGSAAPFVALIKAAGIRMQRRRRRFLVIKEPISVKDGEKEAALLPFGGFRVSYTIEFDHPLLSNQTYLLDFAQEIYEREIGPARTFGFLDEVEGMRANGLALGGSLENAVVVGAGRILNEEGLRFPDEFVRHKILDALGDLWLLGRPLVGQFRAFKAGHSLNHRLLRKVMAVARSWEVLEFPSRQHWREFMLGRSAAAMA